MENRAFLRNGALELLLLPALGGSIARFDYLLEGERWPILRGGDAPASPLDAACFPLVPYCNRVRDGRFAFRGREVTLTPNMAGDPSPLHGQGWLSEWDIASASDDEATLRFSHAAGEWPWHYEARQRFTLGEHRLDVALSCTNRDGSDMPCGLGLHPYFPCRRDNQLTTQVEGVWTVDDDILPVERIPATGRYDVGGGPACGRGLDNGYDGWSGSARIEGADMPFALLMSSPARFFQFYSPPSGELFVAEPVSHANAALNAPEAAWPQLGLEVLRPGETATLSMTLAIEPSPNRA